jgi:hypothetical protein
MGKIPIKKIEKENEINGHLAHRLVNANWRNRSKPVKAIEQRLATLHANGIRRNLKQMEKGRKLRPESAT